MMTPYQHIDTLRVVQAERRLATPPSRDVPSIPFRNRALRRLRAFRSAGPQVTRPATPQPSPLDRVPRSTA